MVKISKRLLQTKTVGKTDVIVPAQSFLICVILYVVAFNLTLEELDF